VSWLISKKKVIFYQLKKIQCDIKLDPSSKNSNLREVEFLVVFLLCLSFRLRFIITILGLF